MEDTYRHKGLRRALVDSLRQKGIGNPQVLDAMLRLPRHWFLDSAFLEHAYTDKAFAIGEGQTISQPYTVAFQTELLDIKPGDKVLEIGTGSGYQACVLAEMGAKVVSVEFNRKLHERARKLVRQLGYPITLIYGDGSLGVPSLAPYQGIIVTAAAPQVPPALVEQLAPSSHLVIPVGEREQQKMLRLVKKSNGETEAEVFANFSFVPLRGKFGWQG